MSSPVDGWSEVRYWQFIRSLLRKGWSKYPAKFEALRLARRKAPQGCRHKWEFQCDKCNNWFMQKEVQVDHVIPAGTLKSYTDLAEFCKNLFCSVDNLRVLCIECHSIKTAMDKTGLGESDVLKAKWVREKLKQRVNTQKYELSLLGFTASEVSNADKRKACYTQVYDKGRYKYD